MVSETASKTLVPEGSNLMFISHSHDDKELALELKGHLRILGFQGFVAHEDIEPTREWENEILKSLKACCGLVAIASQSAQHSSWVNQEIGAVVVRERPVISVKNGCAPWAMLYRYQSLGWQRTATGKLGKPAVRELLEANLPTLSTALGKVGLLTSYHLVEGLGSCWSFEEARVVSKLIEEIGNLEGEEAVRVVYLATVNQNISGCWEAQRALPPLLRPYRDLFTPEQVDLLDAQDFKI